MFNVSRIQIRTNEKNGVGLLKKEKFIELLKHLELVYLRCLQMN